MSDKLTVKQVIERLRSVNPDAEFTVTALNRVQRFTWSHGSAEGSTEANCQNFGPYLDELNLGEKTR